MDKKKIKEHLAKRFLSEDVTPGIAVTNKVKKDNAKVNKDGVKAIEKDVTGYDKDLKQKGKDMDQMAPNKYSYDDKFEKTYHDEMEIMNGQEMLQYDSKPDARFLERAEEAIAGSSNMGNNPEWANVVDKQQGFEGPDFGKNLVKKIKASTKKRSDETPTLNLRGRDIQADIKDTGHRPYAIEENNNNNNPKIKESMKRLRFKNEFNGLGNALNLIPEGYRVDKKVFEMTDGNETYRIRWEGNLSEGKAIVLNAADKKLVNEDITRMKQLFGYKSQDTLGLVKGNARIDENKIFGDIWNKSKQLLGEGDIESAKTEEGNWEEKTKKAPEATKHVQGKTSTDKGTQAPKAKEGDASKAVKSAPEATKNISKGSTSQGTGTKAKEANWDDVSGGEKMFDGQAPAPKEGNWEAISVPQASDAKKHVQGSASTEKGTQAPKPKTGMWDEAGISQASEAKKHVSLKESEMEDKDEDMVKEEFGDEEDKETTDMPSTDVEGGEGGEEDETGAEPADDSNWSKPEDDGGDDEKEPEMKDLGKGLPDDEFSKPKPMAMTAKLLSSPSTGEYWIDNHGSKFRVPDQYMHIASDPTKKGAEKAAIIVAKMEAETPDVDYMDDAL